jgi:hypothetical protein
MVIHKFDDCDCCEECSEDCTDCESGCDGSDPIYVDVVWNPCGSPSACAGLSGGDDGILTQGGLDPCQWSTDESGASNAGDFRLWVYCLANVWKLDIWVGSGPTFCRAWEQTICVICTGGTPLGEFSIDMYDEGLGANCGTVDITFSDTAPPP